MISADHMGEGDEELGKVLIKGFIYALTEQDVLPQTILFYNGGAKLTCEESPTLEDLKSLEAQGVEILTCGTCLNHYGLTDKLQVGSVTNMYVIAEKNDTGRKHCKTMIYLDNAATTFPKPPEVEHAVMAAFHTIGNAGRGAHAATLDASRIIYGTRERLAELFHAEDASRIAFTANVTESLNIAIQGLFEPGDHVITSVCEHNSVLRPLYLMEQRGVKVTYLPADSKGRIAYDELENAYEPETKAVVIMHASNLTGNVTDLEQIAAFTQKHHLLFVVDAAQTAGVLQSMCRNKRSMYSVLPVIKRLFGPQGTGGIYVRKGVEIRPLFAGGTGVQSYSRTQPKEMPALLEAGTLNGHGIAGLYAALGYLQKTGIDKIYGREMALAERFYNGVKDISGVKIYGDFTTKTEWQLSH